MISPEAGRAGFTIGFFMLFVSSPLLLLTDRGSVGFFVSLITFLIGLIFTLSIVALVKIGTKKG